VIGEIIADVAHSEIMPSRKLQLKRCQQGNPLINLGLGTDRGFVLVDALELIQLNLNFRLSAKVNPRSARPQHNRWRTIRVSLRGNGDIRVC